MPNFRADWEARIEKYHAIEKDRAGMSRGALQQKLKRDDRKPAVKSGKAQK
jgi:hypothetical protein